ncbi:B3 domain-containing protein [Acorus gramineus]|uniref:B3 domain-containing protein n=1 Tax=Acorus gramineus TaxID=55184 RepID=A0AAV8ZXL7_ACOGR|nr:B3 domain-containing protein [Acorus gramineus]
MVAEKRSSYEEIRQRTIEENKKKLEELNLSLLTKSLRETASPKPSPAMLEYYNSDRPRNKTYKRRDLLNRVYASDEARHYAIKRAQEIESTLGPDSITFVKPMLQSHTTGGFWLGLPNYFCKEHLPKVDTRMTLIDEAGDEHETNYLAQKNGLSAGWRGFAIEHELVDGDAVVFHLVNQITFKVYIVRQSGFAESKAVASAPPKLENRRTRKKLVTGN